MEDYARKLRHVARSHGDPRRFKKILIVAGVVLLLGFIVFVVLAVLLFSWLFNRTDEIQQAGKNLSGAAQQVLPEMSPLNLESYITNNQVNAEQLQQTFTALPSQLQDMWLGQFKTQLEDLQTQAGIPAETIQSLTSLYNSFQQLQGQ